MGHGSVRRAVPTLLALGAVLGLVLPVLVPGGWSLGIAIAATGVVVITLCGRLLDAIPDDPVLCSVGFFIGLFAVAGPVFVRQDVLAVVGREVTCPVVGIESVLVSGGVRGPDGTTRTAYRTTIACPGSPVTTVPSRPRGLQDGNTRIVMVADAAGLVEPQLRPASGARGLAGWGWTVAALGWLVLLTARRSVARRSNARDRE